MNPNQPNPDAIWAHLNSDVKLKILGYLGPDDLDSTKQVDKQTHELVERLRVNHCLGILNGRITRMRKFMEPGALTKETTRHARDEWILLQQAFQDVADNIEVDLAKWSKWTEGSIYYPLRQKYESINDIDRWHQANLD